MIIIERIKEIAKPGEHFLTREARDLAQMYIDLDQMYKDLKRKLAELMGGEVKRINSDKMGHKYIAPPRQHESKFGHRVDVNVGPITDMLKNVARIKVNESHINPTIEGIEADIEMYLALVRYINKTLQVCYNTGYKDGSNLIQRLSRDQVTIPELDAINRRLTLSVEKSRDEIGND